MRANLFGEFVIDKLVELFPEWNYNRAIELPTNYIAEKFHTLPENIKESLIQVFNVADESAGPMEEEIRSEFKNIKGTLSIDVEEAENERLISEAVASDPKMQELGARCKMILLLKQSDQITISNAKVQIGYEFFDSN